jgi:Peptidase S24-like/Bacteriophage CI repressor helix-turn-helix domain
MEHNKAFIQAIIDRMKTVLGVLREKEVAEHFDGARSNVSAWKRRGSIPFAECLEIAEKYNVSLDWLILGRGSMELGAAPAYVPGPGEPGVVVPAFDIDGLKELPEGQWWTLPAQWLIQEGLTGGEIVIVRAAGDSMSGSIEDGQAVLVDRRQRDIDGVYLVRIGGSVRFKRLQRMVDGSLRLFSDNPAYAADIIAPGDQDQIEIIGYCHAVVKRLR